MRQLIAAGVLLVSTALPVAAQSSIDFDGTGAPCEFISTSPLTTLYSGQGVTFLGSGSILNQCSNFQVGSARSGTDFLAYSGSFAIEEIRFSSVQSFFEIYIGSVSVAEFHYFLNSSNPIVSRHHTHNNADVWTQESFTGAFDSVIIISPDGPMTLDDLNTVGSVTATPEPASMMLLATGLIGVGAVVRRRRKQLA